jgi:hypothetical protein
VGDAVRAAGNCDSNNEKELPHFKKISTRPQNDKTFLPRMPAYLSNRALLAEESGRLRALYF